jgi:proteasome assembly chaperone 3
MAHPTQTKISILSTNGEVCTDIICTTYNDRHFVVISQMKKFGTLINAWAETKADGGKSFDMVTLLGRRDDPLLNVYARQLIEKISLVSDKPLLLAVALVAGGRDVETFQNVLNNIASNNSWQ